MRSVNPVYVAPTSTIVARAHAPVHVAVPFAYVGQPGPRIIAGGITEALLADHNAARTLISQIQANPRTAPTHWPRLSSMLARHDKAEARTLYRALQRFPQIRPQIQRSEREHAALGGMLRRLDSTSYAHPVWRSRFDALVGALDRHLAVEESSVFDFTRTVLSLAQQRALAARYRSLMQSLKAAAPIRVTRTAVRGVARTGRAVTLGTKDVFDRILRVLLPIR